MPPFSERLAAVFAEGYEGDAQADLLSAFAEDSSIADAKVGELTASTESLTATLAQTTAASEAEINRLKAVNYDLLMQTGTVSDESSEPGDEPEVSSFDDLFTKAAS